MKLQTKLKAVHFCCIDATTNFTSFWKTGNNSSGIAQQIAKANKLPHWCKIYMAVIVNEIHIMFSMLWEAIFIHLRTKERLFLFNAPINILHCYISPFSSMDEVLTISGRCMPLMSHSSSILSPCCTGRDDANAGQTELEEILKIYDHKYTCK